MLEEQTILKLAKMIASGDAYSTQLSTNVIGRLAEYGPLLWPNLNCYNPHYVLDCLRSLLQVDVAPHLIQCSSIDCMAQFAKHGIWSCSVQFAVSYCPADVLDASQWPDIFNVLLPIFGLNSDNASQNRDNDVQPTCLRCISQSFKRGMISPHLKGTITRFYRVADNCCSALLEGALLRVIMRMLEDEDHYFRVFSLKAIAELVKYSMFPVRTPCIYL
jgi:hypothetical protein